MEQARAVFRDADATEFVVVTIPTVMAAAESVRLVAALRKEQVPVHALLVNQARTLGLPLSCCFGRRGDFHFHLCTVCALHLRRAHAVRMHVLTFA